MTTHYRQTSVSGNSQPLRMPLKIQGDPIPGREFELIIVTRSPVMNGQTHRDLHPDIIHRAEGVIEDELAIITARTIRNWIDVAKAIVLNQPLEGERISGVNAVRITDEVNALDEYIRGIPESEGEPYCTVFNTTNYYNPGLSITVYSWDDGTAAYQTALSHIRAVDMFVKYAPRFGVTIAIPQRNAQQQTSPPAQIGSGDNPIGKHAEGATPPDDRDLKSVNVATLKPYIRATRASLAPNLISIETGKKANPSFATQAIVATLPYDYKTVQYQSGQYIAYELAGALKVTAYTDAQNVTSLYVDIPTNPGGQNIRIYDRGGESNYDWGSLAQHLGTDTQGLRDLAGNTFFTGAKYVVMKSYHKGDKEYMNYSGLYHGISE